MNATWDALNKHDSIILSNNNLTASGPASASVYVGVKATAQNKKNNFYFEMTVESVSNRILIGIANQGLDVKQSLGTSAPSFPSSIKGLMNTGIIYQSSVTVSGGTFAEGDVIGVAFNINTGDLSFYKNGVFLHTVKQLNASDNWLPFMIAYNSNDKSTVNFGSSEFKYTIPEGFEPYTNHENKSLIFHNNEYKTVTPEIPYSPPVLGAKVAVVPNMTSNTAPSGLVFASSFEGGREPWRAFNNNNAGLTYTFKTPNYKADGEFIGYIFTEAQKISSYAIYPVNIGPLYGWDFQISNDTTDGSNGTWTTVDTKRNQNMTQSLMHYDLSNEVAAKAFRIVTRPAIGAGNLISSWLRQIQIYKKEILSPEIPAQPMRIVAVSTAIPTVDQFMEHGMEQLSPLLDRVTKESDPIPMIQIDL